MVTPMLALQVGWAVGRDAITDTNQAVVIGRDGRTTGDGLADAVGAGVMSAGATAIHLGAVPTPALAYASRRRRGIAVTASHNPPLDNGLKLFVDGVEYDESAEARINDRLDSTAAPVEWSTWGTRRTESCLAEYRQSVKSYAAQYGRPIDELRVAVDTGNGVAGLTTPQILRGLGADVVTLNGNVDGYFSGRESKPTQSALTDFRRFLEADDAGLGIAHDGDGDRIVILDDNGEIVHEDTILAILGAHFVRESEAPDPVVVTTPNASGRVDEQVREAGGRTERVRLGAIHEGIARVERSGGSVVFAGEPWKHVHPRLGGWIDGAATAAVLAQLLAETDLFRLRDPVTERPYRKESVDCPNEAKAAVMESLQEQLPKAFGDVSVSTEHGVRVTRQDDSWVLVRPSGTEPKIRIYAEADDIDSVLDSVRAIVLDVIESATADR